MISFFALNVFWKVLRGSWKRGAEQRRRQGGPTNISQRIFGAQREVLEMGWVKREFWREFYFAGPAHQAPLVIDFTIFVLLVF